MDDPELGGVAGDGVVYLSVPFAEAVLLTFLLVEGLFRRYLTIVHRDEVLQKS